MLTRQVLGMVGFENGRNGRNGRKKIGEEKKTIKNPTFRWG